MRFDQAITWLNSYQFHGIKPGLERISALLSALGHPERKFPCVHLAGTNGKGSTAAILAGLLSRHGVRTGLYTSPHLVSICERFRINGKEISPERLAEILGRIKTRIERLGLPATYFEITTAAAFLYFAEEEVDIGVIECGLGGRLDATNVCRPVVCVITNVGKDHMKYLGRTLREIAREKAGIIKPKVPVVTGRLRPPAQRVVREKASKTQSPLYLLGHDFKITRTKAGFNYRGLKIRLRGLKLSLEGEFQKENLGVALAALEVLHERGFPLEEPLVRKALAEVSWPGRFEFWAVGPGIVLDGAHNEDGLRALLTACRKKGFSKYTLIFGATNEGGDKPYLRMLKKLLPGARKVFLCEPPGPRNPVSLREWALELQKEALEIPVEFSKDPEKALREALSTGYPVLVTGSLYLVGAVRKILEAIR